LLSSLSAVLTSEASTPHWSAFSARDRRKRPGKRSIHPQTQNHTPENFHYLHQPLLRRPATSWTSSNRGYVVENINYPPTQHHEECKGQHKPNPERRHTQARTSFMVGLRFICRCRAVGFGDSPACGKASACNHCCPRKRSVHPCHNKVQRKGEKRPPRIAILAPQLASRRPEALPQNQPTAPPRSANQTPVPRAVVFRLRCVLRPLVWRLPG
jgi:hypothetical protein